MWSGTQALPEDPVELRMAAEGLVSLVKVQALRIVKLEHQLAGFPPSVRVSSDSLDQLRLELKDEEIAAARADKAVPGSDPTAAPKGCPSASPRRRTCRAGRPCSRPARSAVHAAAGSRRWARMSPKSWTTCRDASS
jgi:hypothetical protein